ncbi:zinc finger protein 43-like [Neocloeon triangulifer]|uniref:zinc finger protein 43-like n=1 Tax=Neocloeon triangulifer TaxID=2078957 RepID=UPI00286EF1E8|nr:zinc finger protein 43-like [Neocloeon triangulifer]
MSKGYKSVPYNELCRLCSQITTKRFDIFGEECRIRGLAKSIKKLLCINVSEIDPLPKTICSFCLNRVEDFKEFHANCLSVTQYLQMKLSSVEKGRCYVSINRPQRPASLKRKFTRYLKAPIETSSIPVLSADATEEEEVEVREYEECILQPAVPSSNNYNNEILKLFEDTVDTDYFIQDHDYMSIDPSIRELLGQEMTKKQRVNRDHDYFYENQVISNVAHQELLDHNYFTSLGHFEDNFVNLLTTVEEGKFEKFIEHNYFLPSSSHSKNSLVAVKSIEVENHENNEEDAALLVDQQCEMCGTVFVNLKGHICLADFEQQCEKCGIIFVTKQNFTNHLCSTSDFDTSEVVNNIVQCAECGGLYREMNNHNCLADFDRLCHKCGLVFGTSRLYHYHSCFVKVNRTCDYCQKTLKSKRKFKAHILTHLQNMQRAKSPFTCKICCASFRRLAFFQQHLQKHDTAQNLERGLKLNQLKLNFEISSEPIGSNIRYKCDQCDKRFVRNSNLALHRRLHSKAYSKFTCEVCSAKFLKQTDYCKHVSNHLINYNFPCDECPKGFQFQKELHNHKVRHCANKKMQLMLNARKKNSLE